MNAAQQTYPSQKPTVMVILSGGGFTFETKCLLRDLREVADLVYLRTEFGGVPGSDGLPEGDSILVPQFATKTRGSAFSSLAAFVLTFVATCKLLRRYPGATIVAVGCSHAVPMLSAARVLRHGSVFLESITRADRLSRTGQIVYHLRLADTFLVQWPELHRAYPLSRLGTIL